MIVPGRICSDHTFATGHRLSLMMTTRRTCVSRLKRQRLIWTTSQRSASMPMYKLEEKSNAGS